MTPRRNAPVFRYCRRVIAIAVSPLVVALSGCSSGSSGGDSCTPGDQDGVIGGTNVVLLNVSDTGFAVGGVDSGSTQRNITIQNSSQVTLTLTNVGSKPHSMVVACIPSGLPEGCAKTSCFPKKANLAAVDPGKSVTVTYTVPAVEGAYQFTSDEPGDTSAGGDGGLTGLVGEFVLM